MLKQSFLSILTECTLFFAKAICPGHSDELLDLCDILNFLRKESDRISNNDYISNVNNILKSIKETYSNTSDSRLKLQLLSIVVNQNSSTDIKSIFGCTDYMIAKAKEHAQTNGAGSIVPRQHFHRSRVSFNRIKHFMDFLFGHDFLQDVAHGTTKIRTGESNIYNSTCR